LDLCYFDINLTYGLSLAYSEYITGDNGEKDFLIYPSSDIIQKLRNN